MLNRLETNWVYGGVLSGLVLLLLAPLLGWPTAHVLTFLALPVYMLHQYEEHDADRFRLYVNELVGPAFRGLDHRAVFVINFVGVWLVVLATLWLVRRVDDGWAAIAAYLMLINGIVHILPAIALRRYNPGLVTGVVLFLPLSWAILSAAAPSPAQHLVSILLIVGLHGAIVLYARQPAGAT